MGRPRWASSSPTEFFLAKTELERIKEREVLGKEFGQEENFSGVIKI